MLLVLDSSDLYGQISDCYFSNINGSITTVDLSK